MSRSVSGRKKPCELVVRGPKTERDALLGHLESYQPFTMSFNQLIETFNQRAGRALSAIDLVETSVINVGKTLVSRPNRDRPGAIPGNHAGPGEPNRRLVRRSFRFLETAARGAERPGGGGEDRCQRRRWRAQNPRRGRQTKGRRCASPPEFGARNPPVLASARIQKAGQALAAAELVTDWIRSSLQTLSDRAESLAQQAAIQPAAEDIQTLKIHLDQLVERRKPRWLWIKFDGKPPGSPSTRRPPRLRPPAGNWEPP